MNLTFLGQVSLPESFLLPFLNDHGYKVTIINTDLGPFPDTFEGTDIPIRHLYKESKLRLLFKGSTGLLAKPAFYDVFKTNKRLEAFLKQILKQERIDAIYGSWGTQGLPEFGLLQKLKIPTVYEFRCYPYSRFRFTVKIENCLNQLVVKNLSGRIFASTRMLDYVINNFDTMKGKNVVITECYPKKCFYRKRLPLLSDQDGQKHLIYLGQDAKEILPQITEINRRQIHVHAFFPDDIPTEIKASKYSKFIHSFESFDHSKLMNGELGTFMTQFDACFVTYDLSKVSSFDRFYNSIPARFSFALTGGIPIVLPLGCFKGCEEVLFKYQNGFTYSDYNDLSNQLHKEERLNKYKENSIAKSDSFTLENVFPQIDAFLRKISKP
jgi:hypothetical protein